MLQGADIMPKRNLRHPRSIPKNLPGLPSQANIRVHPDQRTQELARDLQALIRIGTGETICQGTAAHIAIAHAIEQLEAGRISAATLIDRYLEDDD